MKYLNADILELGFHNTPIADGGQIQGLTPSFKNGIKLKMFSNC